MNLPYFTAIPRRWHKRRRPIETAPPVAPLTLVSATFVVGTGMTLNFDRAIDIAGLMTDSFLVNDGAGSHLSLIGFGTPELLSATTVRIGTISMSPYGGSTTTLNADPANGIVALGDGAPWEGVYDLELPFEA